MLFTREMLQFSTPGSVWTTIDVIGSKTDFRRSEKYLPMNIKSMVRPRVLYLYPELRDTKIDYAWGGRIAATMNRLPSVGRIDGNVYYAQGFSGHGVALTNIVGKMRRLDVAQFHPQL